MNCDYQTSVQTLVYDKSFVGEIINLELVTFRRQFETSVHRDIDPEETACLVDMEKVTRRTKILRLFYVCGADSREPLGRFNQRSCADPESFVKGGRTLTTFF